MQGGIDHLDRAVFTMARVVGDLERLLSTKLDELKSRPIPPGMPESS